MNGTTYLVADRLSAFFCLNCDGYGAFSGSTTRMSSPGWNRSGYLGVVQDSIFMMGL
jgi:hypothetical protein